VLSLDDHGLTLGLIHPDDVIFLRAIISPVIFIVKVKSLVVNFAVQFIFEANIITVDLQTDTLIVFKTNRSGADSSIFP
jgi:hypothetical protein